MCVCVCVCVCWNVVSAAQSWIRTCALLCVYMCVCVCVLKCCCYPASHAYHKFAFIHQNFAASEKVCAYVHVYVCHIHTYIHTHTHIYIHTCRNRLQTDFWMQRASCAGLLHPYIHMHACMHDTHTHIHTYIHVTGFC
jgi:hypothetical protein